MSTPKKIILTTAMYADILSRLRKFPRKCFAVLANKTGEKTEINPCRLTGLRDSNLQYREKNYIKFSFQMYGSHFGVFFSVLNQFHVELRVLWLSEGNIKLICLIFELQISDVL